MGVKMSLMVFFEGDAGERLLARGALDRRRAQWIVKQLFPGCRPERLDDGNLSEHVYARGDAIHVGCYAGIDLIVTAFLPIGATRLPESITRVAGPRDGLVIHMDSVCDLFDIDVWRGGRRVRSLAMNAEDGIVRNEGTPFDLEAPFWAGERALEDYHLPFHAHELAEHMLLELLGFYLEGHPRDWRLDPMDVVLCGFKPRPAWYRRLLGRAKR